MAGERMTNGGTQVRPRPRAGRSSSPRTADRCCSSPRRVESSPRRISPTSTSPARKARVAELGHPAFRATQLSNHYFAGTPIDPAEMTDLPAEGREELVAAMLPPLLTEVRRLRTDKGETIKFLWKLFDGALVESVLMRYPGRITLCVSSQAGCGMNCPFCATGQAGLTRNLSAAEIVDQVVAANRAIAAGELGGLRRDGGHDAERVTNIVFMGMGEPLANYARLMKARPHHDRAGARRTRDVRSPHHRLVRRAGARRSSSSRTRHCP